MSGRRKTIIFFLRRHSIILTLTSNILTILYLCSLLQALNQESRKMLHFPLYRLQDKGYRGGVYLII